jgi:hypothetical protein
VSGFQIADHPKFVAVGDDNGNRSQASPSQNHDIIFALCLFSAESSRQGIFSYRKFNYHPFVSVRNKI